ncbi:crooked neck-like protein 1 [Medicago truncatula]|nr:crooked neck-like protein 1 [Medicago truncatula]
MEKNKTDAPIQITTEKILIEAKELQETKICTPKQKCPRSVSEVDDLNHTLLNYSCKIVVFENEVRENPFNYDSWFEYIRLEESVGDKEKTREVYERAISNVPPNQEKISWRRYIYLLINYARYEEFDTRNMERARDVYRNFLKLMAHKKFSSAKLWLLAAQFEIRMLNFKGARRILDYAIGKAPKHKLFKKYIEMELELGNTDRCRKLYVNYLEWSADKCKAWSKYAEDLERSLSETERARAIFESAIARPELVKQELFWKAFHDFETAKCEFERTRVHYERIPNRKKQHLEIWISYAEFEATATYKAGLEQKKQCIEHARRVFEEAVSYITSSAPDSREERAMLLVKWLNLEASSGELGDVSLVLPKLPKKQQKKRRKLTTEDGSSRIEEFFNYRFPEETQVNHLKKQKL